MKASKRKVTVKIKGLAFEHEIKDGRLSVYHKDRYVSFVWPLVFDWSLKMLDWHIRDRLGLRHPDNLPPALYQSYGGLELEQ